MALNVTAIFRTREVAELVRRGLEDIGISRSDIHVLPDPAHETGADRAEITSDRSTTTTTGTGPGSARAGTTRATATGVTGTTPGRAGTVGTSAAAGYPEPGHERTYTDRLHELQLPEEDVRTYQHSIRRGDYLVSVETGRDKVDEVRAIMRRPESEVYDIEHRSSEFRDQELIPHSAGERHRLDEEMRARRVAGDDRYHRTYERNKRLERLGRV